MMRSQGSFQATHRSLEPGMACSRGSGLIQDSTQQPLIMKGQCVAVGRQRELAVPAFHSCPGPEAIHVHEVMQTHPPPPPGWPVLPLLLPCCSLLGPYQY